MKKLLCVCSIIFFALAVCSVFLVAASGETKAAEVKPINWDGDPEHVNVLAFLCDPTKMEDVLADDENTRACVVNAVAHNEDARKMIIQKMLKSDNVRGMIMDAIAKNPALRKQMEEKLAAQK